MESVTIKVQKAMLNEIEKSIKPDYGTKSEFVRAAIREKLKEQRKEKLLQELRKHFGSIKTRTTKKEERRIREEVGKEFAKKFGIDLD